jgi:hypothetical protein
MTVTTPRGIDTPERDRVKKIRDRALGQYQKVRTQKNLTDTGRRARLAAAWRAANAEAQQLLDDERRRLTKRAERIMRDKFGHVSPNDARIISIRDAADRAARVEGPKEAAELMNRAELNGDDVLLTALARECMRRRNPLEPDYWGLFTTWMRQQPDGAEVLEELTTLGAEELESGNRLVRDSVFNVPRPDELTGLSNTQLNELADQADDIPELPPTRAEEVGARFAALTGHGRVE